VTATVSLVSIIGGWDANLAQLGVTFALFAFGPEQPREHAVISVQSGVAEHPAVATPRRPGRRCTMRVRRPGRSSASSSPCSVRCARTRAHSPRRPLRGSSGCPTSSPPPLDGHVGRARCPSVDAAATVRVETSGASVVLTVTNGPPSRAHVGSGAVPGSHEVPSGSRLGLPGMRERVLAVGGLLVSGPTADGGFLGKGVDPDDLLDTIRLVAAGEPLLSPAATRSLIVSFLSQPSRAAVAGAPSRLEQLTDRERKIVALVVEGLTNSEIAERLVISPMTVKTHVNRSMTKLDLCDRAQLVVAAHQLGLVRVGPTEGPGGSDDRRVRPAAAGSGQESFLVGPGEELLTGADG